VLQSQCGCDACYEVLPDGRSFVRSDEDERAIGIFEDLLATLDAVPPSLIKAAEVQRAVSPRLFDEALELSIRAAGFWIVSCGRDRICRSAFERRRGGDLRLERSQPARRGSRYGSLIKE
jgi:hypothetical protein